MKIISGNEAGLIHAINLIRDNPNPDHIREQNQFRGGNESAEAIVGESLANSGIVAYASDGESAFVCGLGLLGFTRFQVWMTATADTTKRPVWLVRQARRLLSLADNEMGRGAIYWQVIPLGYERGLHFVTHLGFRKSGMWRSPITQKEFAVVERKVE